MNTAIALKKAERIHPLVAADRFLPGSRCDPDYSFDGSSRATHSGRNSVLFRPFLEPLARSEEESTLPAVEFRAGCPLVRRKTLRKKFPNLLTTGAPASGKFPVLVKKRVALGLCGTDLFDHDVAIIHKHLLLSSLCRRAREVVTTHPARVKEVLRAARRMAEELFSKWPGFKAEPAFPPRQV